MKADYSVYIGRFQPFTLAHKSMVERAFKEAEKVIIIVGSDKASPSLRNPFTTDERIRMIYSVFQDKKDRIICIPMQDSAYNFTAWIVEVQRKINAIIPAGAFVKLIGHFKDDTSYYLKHFPQWELVSVKSLEGGLSATEIRKLLFSKWKVVKWKTMVPNEVDTFISNWIIEEKHRYENLVSEAEYITKYKNQWKDAPYAPTFVTTDAVVFSHSHILLIKRGRNPGKGQYALPGGFLDQHETIEQGCIRELKEETKIDVAIPILKNSIKKVKVFDQPWRDPRGRTITHAHKIELNLKNIPEVKAADDAAEVKWVPVGQIADMEGMFFNDHLQIIKYFLGISI